MRYSITLQLRQLKTLSGGVLINFNKLFIKTLRLAAIRRLGSSLFHSITVDGKKEFFQKVMFSMKYSNYFCISGL